MQTMENRFPLTLRYHQMKAEVFLYWLAMLTHQVEQQMDATLTGLLQGRPRTILEMWSGYDYGLDPARVTFIWDEHALLHFTAAMHHQPRETGKRKTGLDL